MGTEGTAGFIARQEWMNPAEETLQKAVHKVFQSAGPRGRIVKNFLHGTWMGHPLHVALTDVPIGSWTTAVALDFLEMMTGRREFGAGADAAIGFGILGAVGAAITGLTDWQDIDPPARRIGLAHALLNTGTLGLFALSLAARRNSRNKGRLLALAGFGMGAMAAQLGGELVYGEKIGVDHTAGVKLPEDWVAVMPESELAEGRPRKAEAGGAGVVLVRRGQRILALAETCTHLGGPLAEGTVDGDVIQCPWHGSRFSLEDGSVVDGPAVHPEPCFEVRVRDGQVEVRKASGKPRTMTAA